jgi:integrase
MTFVKPTDLSGNTLKVLAKAPPEKTTKIADIGKGAVPGLYIQLTPAGAIYWRQNYRFAGVQKTLAHGTFPLIGLAQAREAAQEAKRKLKAGIDPGNQKQAEKEAAKEAARPPKDTIAAALEFYEKSNSTGDVAKDKLLSNRMKRLRSRLIASLGEEGFSRRPLEEFKRVEANKLRDDLVAEGLNPNSVRRELNPLRSAITLYQREHDLEPRNPLAGFKIAGATKTSRSDRKSFTVQEVIDLSPTMVKGTGDALGAIWTVLRDTGARGSEICRLTVADVDFTPQREIIKIRAGKSGNAPRDIPLSPAAATALKPFAVEKEPEEYLFPRYAVGEDGRGTDAASQALVKRLRKKIKDPKKVVYSLRHTFKDILRNSNCPESIVEEICGREAQNVAKNYGEGYADKIKRRFMRAVWKAFDKASPAPSNT